jgi:hypothetical protein
VDKIINHTLQSVIPAWISVFSALAVFAIRLCTAIIPTLVAYIAFAAAFTVVAEQAAHDIHTDRWAPAQNVPRNTDYGTPRRYTCERYWDLERWGDEVRRVSSGREGMNS